MQRSALGEHRENIKILKADSGLRSLFYKSLLQSQEPSDSIYGE